MISGAQPNIGMHPTRISENVIENLPLIPTLRGG